MSVTAISIAPVAMFGLTLPASRRDDLAGAR